MGLMNRRDVWNELEVHTHEIPARKRIYDDFLWIFGTLSVYLRRSLLENILEELRETPFTECRRSLLENILEELRETPFTDCRRSLLENILEELHETPFTDYRRSLLENILEGIFGTPSADVG